MTEDERREHATRLIESAAENFDFLDLAEDEDLGEMLDDGVAENEDLEAIYRLMLRAKVTVSWDD